ncbi:fumarylacetoacetase, partial [Streptomyces sp. Ncost-T6T-2b]
PLADFREHVFGLSLLNDWSARDLQAWEYVPLGPFLGKSFATSVSAWVTPLEALDAARTAPPARDFPLLPYLDDAEDEEPGGFDIRITVAINGQVVAEPPFASMYWTAAQQLAHMTVNGASLRTGDLYGSGTVTRPRDAPARLAPGAHLERPRRARTGRGQADVPGGRRHGHADRLAPGPHGPASASAT